MRAVAAAKSTGSGHLIWPKDRNIETVSQEFVTFLNHTLLILSWQENLASDEMPPYWMWHLDWEIEKHFDKVKREREKKYGSTPQSSVEDLDPNYEENEYYKEMMEQINNQ